VAAADTLPVDPDYGMALTRETNVLAGRVESARTFLRQKAASPRIWRLVWLRRPKTDWDLLQDFRHKMLTDFFTFFDKESAVGAFTGRKYSVEFVSEPVYQFAGFEQIDMNCDVREKIGAAMATYPSFSGDYPFGNIPVASAVDLGGNGKLFSYPGYGYRVNGTFTTIYLDELVTGGENPKTDVVLGLHRVRVVGGSPTSLDYLI
jgi:hypothetical protein